MIRLVIADDLPLVRQGLRALLDLEADLRVVALAGDGTEALAAVAAHQPDIVLMDLRMPGLDGVAATRLLRERHPEVAVLILTTFDDRGSVIEALAAGARGYLLKDSDSDEIAAAVRAVAAGESPLPPRLVRTVLDELARLAAAPPPGPPAAPGAGDDNATTLLTVREIEVLRLVAEGLTDAQVAARLFVSTRTVSQHLRSIYSKLDVSSRVAATRRAGERGLL